jgi:hypothetical protein
MNDPLPPTSVQTQRRTSSGNERATFRFGEHGRHSLKASFTSVGCRAVRGAQPHPHVRDLLVSEFSGQHLAEVGVKVRTRTPSGERRIDGLDRRSEPTHSMEASMPFEQTRHVMHNYFKALGTGDFARFLSEDVTWTTMETGAQIQGPRPVQDAVIGRPYVSEDPGSVSSTSGSARSLIVTAFPAACVTASWSAPASMTVTSAVAVRAHVSRFLPRSGRLAVPVRSRSGRSKRPGSLASMPTDPMPIPPPQVMVNRCV